MKASEPLNHLLIFYTKILQRNQSDAMSMLVNAIKT